jgi:hypothetical protein
MRNTKEISLMEVRNGRESELPEALHPAEFGFAVDTNRLFIGNPNNPDLKTRVEFPYKNLEILTEFTDLSERLVYQYVNNIDGNERLPIVIVSTDMPDIVEATNLGIQTLKGADVISLEIGDTLETIVNKINESTNQTIRAFATTTNKLCIVCYDIKIVFEGESALTQLKLPVDVSDSELLPARLFKNKLDDFVTSSDFGVIGNGSSEISIDLINSLRELYNKNVSKTNRYQYNRVYQLLAGKYIFGGNESFPLLANMHIKGDGIDKTIIVATSDYAGLGFFKSVDENLKSGGSTSNIIIEDMTFDLGLIASVMSIGEIYNSTNIVFRNVKFVGNSNITSLKLYNSTNIVFDNCIFENFIDAIYGTNVTHLRITNSTFNTIYRSCVKLENSIGLIMDSNIMTSCALSTGYKGIVDISNNCSYSTIHQTVFDGDALQDYSLMFKRADGDVLNYIDTLDSSTNERKQLKFKFLQPQWEYIDYLVNQAGETVVVIDDSKYGVSSEEYPLAKNPLKILTTDNLTLENMGTGDMIIKSSPESDVVVGEFDGESDAVGNIITKKDIELNGSKIKNLTGNNDIEIQTADDKVIIIDDTTTTDTPYENRILGNEDAVPNVAYVDRMSKMSMSTTIDYTTEFSEDGVKLISFPLNEYGNAINLRNISINVRKAFLPIFENTTPTKALNYTVGFTYYKGNVVWDSTSRYAIVTETHKATSGFGVELGNRLTEIKTGLKDIKYVDVYAKPIDGMNLNYYLTRVNYDPEYAPIINDMDLSVDVTANSIKAVYPGCPAVGTVIDDGSFTEQHLYYQYDNKENEDDSYTIASALDLHNDLYFAYTPVSGYNYKFDLDREYAVSGSNNYVMMDEINFAGYELYLRCFDLDGNMITPIALSDTSVGENMTKLNPIGSMRVTVDFNRG